MKFWELLISKKRDITVQEFEVMINQSIDAVYLKRHAVEACVGLIVSAISLVRFETSDKNLRYRLNFRPNQNQSAVDFWREVVRKLVYEDGECLVVKTDDHRFFVADDWEMERRILKDNVYRNIRKGGVVIARAKRESDVFFFQSHNEELRKIIAELDGSYGELFLRMINIMMHRGQIRASLNLKTTAAKAEDDVNKHQGYINKVTKSIKKNAFALFPLQDSQEYKEHQKAEQTGWEVSDIDKMSDGYLAKVATAMNIPPSLILGNVADTTEHSKNFIRNTIRPLLQIITKEITRKYFSEKEVMDGEEVKANTAHILYNSEFEMADDIQKLVGSGTHTIDDVLEMMGRERKNTKITNKRWMTRNLASAESIERG